MKKLYGTLAAALLLAPLAARADSEFSIVLEGGATHYTQSLNSGTDTGALYGARLGIMPTPIVGFELGYMGTQNNVRESLNAGRQTGTLRTNGGYGDVRINILPGPLTPYAFGGFGITHVDAPSGGTDAYGLQSRNVSTIPFGAGLEANLGAFKLGARFQYNYLFDKIYAGTAPNSAGISADKGGNADFYGVGIDLGASFR
jgi:opacity protein-like surface antigen